MTTTGQIIQTPDTAVSPNFFVPPSVVDLRYLSEEEQEREEQDDSDVPSDQPVPVVDSIPEVSVGTEYADSTHIGASEIPTPDWMTVQSQIVKIGTDGTTLVDVTIEVQDIPGVQEVDVAVTKV